MFSLFWHFVVFVIKTATGNQKEKKIKTTKTVIFQTLEHQGITILISNSDNFSSKIILRFICTP
jgi:hypothetical protein